MRRRRGGRKKAPHHPPCRCAPAVVGTACGRGSTWTAAWPRRGPAKTHRALTRRWPRRGATGGGGTTTTTAPATARNEDWRYLRAIDEREQTQNASRQFVQSATVAVSRSPLQQVMRVGAGGVRGMITSDVATGGGDRHRRTWSSAGNADDVDHTRTLHHTADVRRAMARWSTTVR